MPAPSPSVAPASGGPVTDDVLGHLIDILKRVRTQPVSDAEGMLLDLNLQPCLEELLDWRQRGHLAAQILAPANIIRFPAVR